MKTKPKGEKAFFFYIWLSTHPSDRKSIVSGKSIDHFDVRCFAHVLGKGAYPKLRLYRKNITLLTPFEHKLYDHGSQEERDQYAFENNCSWNQLEQLAEDLMGFHLSIDQKK